MLQRTEGKEGYRRIWEEIWGGFGGKYNQNPLYEILKENKKNILSKLYSTNPPFLTQV